MNVSLNKPVIGILINLVYNVFLQSSNMTREQLNQCHNQFISNMDQVLVSLKKKLEQQKNADEQERLRKIEVCLCSYPASSNHIHTSVFRAGVSLNIHSFIHSYITILPLSVSTVSLIKNEKRCLIDRIMWNDLNSTFFKIHCCMLYFKSYLNDYSQHPFTLLITF